jgi:hypothetical protein
VKKNARTGASSGDLTQRSHSGSTDHAEGATTKSEIKNRGVVDMFIVCADGLKGITEAIAAVWPLAIHQTRVVHMVCGILAYTNRKDCGPSPGRKDATDLRSRISETTAEGRWRGERPSRQCRPRADAFDGPVIPDSGVTWRL